jgi:hypothetical protein
VSGALRARGARRPAARATLVPCWLALTGVIVACQGSPREAAEHAPAASSAEQSAYVRWPLAQSDDYQLEIQTANNVGQSPVAVLLALSASLRITFRAHEGGTRAEVALRDVRLLDHAKRPAEGPAETEPPLLSRLRLCSAPRGGMRR